MLVSARSTKQVKTLLRGDLTGGKTGEVTVVCLTAMPTKSNTSVRTGKKQRTRSAPPTVIGRTPIVKPAAQIRREKITAAGGRQLNVLLKPAPNRALGRLMKHYGLPAVQVVTQLLTDAAAQLRKPGKEFKSATVTSAAKSIRPRRSATRHGNNRPR